MNDAGLDRRTMIARALAVVASRSAGNFGELVFRDNPPSLAGLRNPSGLIGDGPRNEHDAALAFEFAALHGAIAAGKFPVADQQRIEGALRQVSASCPVVLVEQRLVVFLERPNKDRVKCSVDVPKDDCTGCGCRFLRNAGFRFFGTRAERNFRISNDDDLHMVATFSLALLESGLTPTPHEEWTIMWEQPTGELEYKTIPFSL